MAETNSQSTLLVGAVFYFANKCLDNATHSLCFSVSHQNTFFVKSKDWLNVQKACILYLVSRKTTTFK